MANNQIALLARAPEFDTPFESQGKALQLRALMNQAQAQDMDMQARRRALDDESALRNVYASVEAPEDRIKALYRINPKAAMAAEKSQLEFEKLRSDAGKEKASAAKTEQETINMRMARARDLLGTVNDRDTATSWVRGMYADPDIGKILTQHLGPVDAAVGRIPNPAIEPDKFADWKLSSQLNAEKLASMKFADANARLSADTSVKTTKMNNDTSRANNAATVAQSERASLRTDDRQREANQTQRELLNQEKALKIGEMQEKAADRKRSKDASISSVGNQIAVIDKALGHPGRATATGLSGTLDPTNYIPGTDASDFRAVLDQIGGAAFLQAFESLKGGGQITEIEGKKATDAIARLSRAQSDTEFETSLKDLRDVMTAGYKRLSGQDYAKPGTPAKAAPPRQNNRGWTLMVDKNGNQAYVSPDGKSFEEVK